MKETYPFLGQEPAIILPSLPLAAMVATSPLRGSVGLRGLSVETDLELLRVSISFFGQKPTTILPGLPPAAMFVIGTR
jgi:hypothetical protein